MKSLKQNVKARLETASSRKGHVLVVNTQRQGWGTGSTLTEAVKSLQKSGRTNKCDAAYFSTKPLSIDDMGNLHFDKTAGYYLIDGRDVL